MDANLKYMIDRYNGYKTGIDAAELRLMRIREETQLGRMPAELAEEESKQMDSEISHAKYMLKSTEERLRHVYMGGSPSDEDNRGSTHEERRAAGSALGFSDIEMIIDDIKLEGIGRQVSDEDLQKVYDSSEDLGLRRLAGERLGYNRWRIFWDELWR